MTEDKTKARDPRIRLQTKKHRVVAPEGRESNGRVYANGALLVEELRKDGLGNEVWTHVETFSRPTTQSSESAKARYNLLANGVDDEV